MDMATGGRKKQADKGESWRSPEESFDWDILTELFQRREVEPRGVFCYCFSCSCLRERGEALPVINSLRCVGWQRALLDPDRVPKYSWSGTNSFTGSRSVHKPL